MCGGWDDNTTTMLTLQKIAKQLSTIATIDEALDIKNKAEAIRVYSRQQKHCKHIERETVIIRLSAERRLGKLLARTMRRGNPKVTQGDFSLPKGITKNQSSARQLGAKLPVREFEKHLQSASPSTLGVIKLAKRHVRKHLTYVWCFSIVHKNQNAPIGQRIGCKWRPVVAFSNGKPEHEYIVDCVTSSGTTLAAAKALNRRFLGCELDRNVARGARRRAIFNEGMESTFLRIKDQANDFPEPQRAELIKLTDDVLKQLQVSLVVRSLTVMRPKEPHRFELAHTE